MGYVYKICNDINDKVYVGKTLINVDKRFQEHLRDAMKDKNKNRPLYSAIKKYGKQHFHVELIEECDDSVISDRERFWVKKLGCFHNGYNATRGGDGKTLFNRDMILDELLLCPYQNIVAKKIGCSVDLVRIVARKYGIKVHSIAQQTMKEQKSKRVTCECDDFCLTFDSIADAARWLKRSGILKSSPSGARSKISECARGIRKSAYGFKWRYI